MLGGFSLVGYTISSSISTVHPFSWKPACRRIIVLYWCDFVAIVILVASVYYVVLSSTSPSYLLSHPFQLLFSSFRSALLLVLLALFAVRLASAYTIIQYSVTVIIPTFTIWNFFFIINFFIFFLYFFLFCVVLFFVYYILVVRWTTACANYPYSRLKTSMFTSEHLSDTTYHELGEVVFISSKSGTTDARKDGRWK